LQDTKSFHVSMNDRKGKEEYRVGFRVEVET
jgi:hypothetical protein